MRGAGEEGESRLSKAWISAALLLLAGAAFLAYYPVLDNGFYIIDDQRHLANGMGFPFPNHYFRPGQEWSFRLLWPLAGTDPFPYYLTGLLFHLAATVLTTLLAWKVLKERWAALAAGLVFATLYAPSQAVLWIGAHLGVQSVTFALASLLFWIAFLERGGWFRWAGSLVFGVLAMCFKESGVNLLPFMLVVYLRFKGPRALLRPRNWLPWIPLVLFAAYVTWHAVTVPGGIGLEVRMSGPLVLLDRLLRSIGHMPIPLNFRRHRAGLQVIGLVFPLLPFLGALLAARARAGKGPLPPAAGYAAAAVAVGLLLAGHAAVLPVEGEATGERDYYDAAPGFALMLAVLFSQARILLAGKGKVLRSLPWIGLLAWCGINVLSLHKVEAWKYDAPSRHVERLVRATGRLLEKAPRGKTLFFLDPPMRDVRDFERILEIYYGADPGRIRQIWYDPRGERLRRRIREEKDLVCLRWRESPPAWIPFEPGGWKWLEKWKPFWWPSPLDDPHLSHKIRCLEYHLPGG